MHSDLPSAPNAEREARDTANLLESLTNLIYLTKLEADRPEQVRHYMDISAERLKAIVEVFHRPH